ncbi:hypothetical protein RDABS01_023277 [Bienertia sinuspersici]
MDLNTRLKPCTSTDSHSVVDRLTDLPIELLIRILSLLPTMDAAATCVLSKRLRSVFPWITTLDFDCSTNSFNLSNSYKIKQFSSFASFVDTVIGAYQSPCLTRFRLRIDYDYCISWIPDFNANQILAWISFPFTRCGLKELEIFVNLGNRVQLPPEMFMCETLEALKLDFDFGLDQASTLPFFRLPNLKQLHLCPFHFSEHGFIRRLVSSCPLLEDLLLRAYLTTTHCLNISSPSLRKLHVSTCPCERDYDITNVVLIHTPKLENFYYFDDLETQYSITYMDCLVKASIMIERSFTQILGLLRSVSNVQHLCLNCNMEFLNKLDLKEKLPVFRNLKHLELCCFGNSYWNNVVLTFLHHSPVLETLDLRMNCVYFMDSSVFHFDEEALDSEQEFSETALGVIPCCCKTYLKRIVINCYSSQKGVVKLIRFLLRHALVLEELVVYQLLFYDDRHVDQKSIENTYKNFPRASVTCSIQVHCRTS